MEPNNAILVVAGDVKAAEVFKMAEKYFGKIPPIVLPERKPQLEPIQNGTRTSILKASSKLSYVQMGYRAPTLDKNSQITSKDQFALEVLVGILSQSSSARLTQNLVRDSRVALNVGAGYSRNIGIQMAKGEYISFIVKCKNHISWNRNFFRIIF